MTQLYMRLDSSIRVMAHTYDVGYMKESWLTHMNEVAMTPSHMRHECEAMTRVGSHIYLKSPWLLRICDTSVTPSHSCRICEGVMATRVMADTSHDSCHVWAYTSHATRVMAHTYLIYVTWFIHMCEPWLLHICDMTPRSYMQHDSFTRVSHDEAIIYATWLVHICDMTHSYVLAMTHLCTRLDSFRCVSHDSFIYTTWLIHVCDMTHAYVLAMTYLYVRAITFMCMWPPTHLHLHRNRNRPTESLQVHLHTDAKTCGNEET